jgi:Domain of unknown function DUF11
VNRRGAVATATAAALMAIGALAPSASAAPPNDNFASAQPLGAGTITKNASGTTSGATAEPNEPHHLSYPVGDAVSVWYSWRAGSEAENVTLEACGDNNINAGVAVYRGSGLGSLQQVAQADYEYCQPAPRTGFTADPGVTYWIAVTSDTNPIVQGPFTLHFSARPVPFEDAAIKQEASRQSLPRGGRVTYTVTLTNRGNTSIRAIWVHLFASKPGHEAIPAKNLTYISFRSTRGRCHRQIYFAEHKGVMCAIGRLEPGQKAVITAKVRLRESITHWASLDYSPGTGASSSDDNKRNDQRKLTTRVRP